MSVACWGAKPMTTPHGQVCATCGERIHFVPRNWLVPRTGLEDPRSPGFWRHNPRRIARG